MVAKGLASLFCVASSGLSFSLPTCAATRLPFYEGVATAVAVVLRTVTGRVTPSLRSKGATATATQCCSASDWVASSEGEAVAPQPPV
jgi:hypothetical protein